ncbi:MAG: hypothetical protein MMC33_004077 [Icmadophila ericetorum]|nr:hypothetical protein [Icmadophila ericetorum]
MCLPTLTPFKIFYGTPHRLSNMLAWESLLYDLILVSSLRDIKSRISETVRKFAEFASNLSIQFHSTASKYSVVSVYGNKDGQVDTAIVSESSAILGLAFEVRKQRNKDHLALCKYSEFDDDFCDLGALIMPHSLVIDSKYMSCLQTLSALAHGIQCPPKTYRASEWILEHEQYHSWLSGHSRGSLLYLQRLSSYDDGILLYSLYTHLRKGDHGSSLVASFSFDEQDERQNNVVSLLSSLVCQILSVRPSLFSSVRSLYMLAEQESIWTNGELWIFLQRLVKCRECTSVIAIIDATGYSYDSQLMLLEDLANFTHSLRSRFKVLFIGKVIPARAEAPAPYNLITLGRQETDGANLKLHLECGVSALIDERPILAPYVTDISVKLCDASNHVDPLLASLLLESVKVSRFQSTPQSIRRLLDDLPGTIRGLIDIILRDLPVWASKALSWMMHVLRPLNSEELAVAIALEPSATSLESIRDNVPMKMSDDIKEVFSILVKVENDEVRFAHPQIKEEIKQSTVYCSSEMSTHWDITDLCLTYLSMDEFKNREFASEYAEKSLPRIWQFDLVKYAVRYWPSHYQQAVTNTSRSERITEFLSNPLMQKWVQVESNFGDINISRKFCNVTPLQFAARHGLRDVVPSLLLTRPVHADDESIRGLALLLGVRSGSHIVAKILLGRVLYKNSVKEKALNEACARGDESMVNILLKELCSKPDSVSLPQHPLCKAAQRGFIAIVERLIEAGASVSTNMNVEQPKEQFALPENRVLDEEIPLIYDVRPSYRGQKGSKTPLHYAAENGHHDVVGLLLRHHAPINAVDGTHSTPLLLATANGHLRTIDELFRVDRSKADILMSNSTGHTPLHYAVQHNFVDILKLLLQRNPDLEATTQDGSRALHLAAANGGVEAVKLLLVAGVDINALNGQKHTALFNAAKRGSGTITELLLDRGADPTLEDHELDSTPLIQAATNDLATTVNFMLQKGLNLEVTDAEGYTALHRAAAQGHDRVINYLLDCKANVRQRTPDGQQPLHLAAAIGSNDAIEALLSARAEVNASGNSTSNTALQIAVTGGYPETVSLLLHKRADFKLIDERGRNLLHLAAFHRHHEVVKILLEHNLSVMACDNLGWTPLHYAASNGNEVVTSLLLQHKYSCDPGARDCDGWTPLHVAAQQGYVNIMEELCRSQNIIGIQTNDGRTPLHIAYNQKEAAEWLLNHWANVDKVDHCGRTALTHAVEDGFSEIVQIFLDTRPDVNLTDLQGQSYVHFAASHGHWNILEQLKEANAKLESKDKQRRTILHHAAAGGATMVERLLEPGWLSECNSTVETPDRDGWTMLHWACKGSSLETVQLLINTGAHPHKACSKGWTPSRIAAFHGRKELTSYLQSLKIPSRDPNATSVEACVAAGEHSGSRCAGCHWTPIFGTRYKCDTCWDFSFCFKCYWSHEWTHPKHRHRFWAIEPGEEENDDELGGFEDGGSFGSGPSEASDAGSDLEVEEGECGGYEGGC